MKKLLVLMLLLSFLMAAVYSQDAELGYREAGVSQARLYPGGNFYSYPSRLAQLENQLLWTRIYLNFSNWGDNVDTQVGPTTNEGTFTSKPGDWVFDLDGSYFFKASDDITLGFKLDDKFTFNTTTDTSDNEFTTAGETVTIVQRDTQFELAPQAFLAMPLGDFNFGARLRFYTLLDPVEEEFEQTTDTAQNGGTMFYSDGNGANNNDNGNSNIQLTAGIDGTSGDLEWGVSLAGSYAWDENKRMFALDSDGDTFADTIVDEATYETDPNGGASAYYDRKNMDTTLSLGLLGYGKYPLNNNGTLIFTASWYPMNSTVNESYTHTVSTDKTSFKRTESSGLGNLFLSGAYATDLGDKWTFRGGTGFGFSITNYANEATDATGANAYDPQNTDKLAEAALGAVPADNSVTGTGNSQTEMFNMYFPIDIEVRFSPSREVTIFSNFNTWMTSQNDTYKVFNTTDNAVWTETESSFSALSNSSLAGGLDVALTESLNVVFTTRYNFFDPDLSSADETLPSDSSGAVDGEINKTVNDSLTVDLNFVFRF